MKSKILIQIALKVIQNCKGSIAPRSCQPTRLTDLKKELVLHRSHPPTSLKIDWRSENLLSRLTWGLPSPIQPSAQGLRFDVIVISEQGGRHHFSEITQLASLPIESLAATPSFLFLWLPSSDSLEDGRMLLQKWGFRRAEDIVWVKTNHTEIERWKSGGPMPIRRRRQEDGKDAVFARTKEHCLMGIRGTVRRSVPISFGGYANGIPGR
jgi:mRNA m6A methyltransferase non-catalytic subunit